MKTVSSLHNEQLSSAQTPNNTQDDHMCMDFDVSSRQEEPTYQSIVNPDNLKTDDDYLSLDTASRQENITYQGLVNPDDLKTNDDYLRLDDASRKAETEYQDLNLIKQESHYTEIPDIDADKIECSI